MTTVAEAICRLGLAPDDATGERALAIIKPGGKPIHSTVSKQADKPLESFDSNTYYTPARFKPGSVTVSGGRTAENAVSLDLIMFDADLKDYLGVSLETLHAAPHPELDAYVNSLSKDLQEVFSRCGIPVHRIDATGYGIAVYVRLKPADQTRLEEARHVNKELIGRINRTWGGTLVDPAVSDPTSRLMRLVGTPNVKGASPRPVRTLIEFSGEASLDDFKVVPKPTGQSRPPVAPRVLSDDIVGDIVLALANEYTEGKRNVIALGLPALTVKAGVPREQALSIIEQVGADDEELAARRNAVNRTYDKWERGQSVSGHRMLLNTLSSSLTDFLDERLRRVRITVESSSEETVEPTLSYTSVYDAPPAEAYYGLAGAYCDLVAPCTAAAAQYHLMSFLAYHGASIGRRAHVYHVRRHYPILMAVLIGDTGSYKDTAADLARDFFEMGAETRPNEISALPYNVISDLSTAEGLLQYLSDHGSRAMIHTSEFAILLGKARREFGNGVLPLITRLWDGVGHVDLPTRKDPIRIESPTINMLATITPQILAEKTCVEDIRSGFSNRVLWIYGSTKGRISLPPKPDYAEQRRLFDEIRSAVDASCGEGQEFSLSPRAAKLFDDWDRTLFERVYLNEDERHLSERLEGNALRIGLLHAACDGDSLISEAQLQAAIHFVEWQFTQVVGQSRMWGANDEARLGELIMEILRRQPLHRAALYERLQRWGASTLYRSLEALSRMEMITHDGAGLMHATGGA
jgi:hypothetical protein